MTVLVKEFLTPICRSKFDGAGPGYFESLWTMSLTPVEEGNVRNGGWSNVCTCEMSGARFYVKRQANYFTRTIQSFFRKTPIANVEFEKINLFQKIGIPTLDVVYFGWRKKGKESQAILVTRSLEGYKALDDVLLESLSFNDKARLFSGVGNAIAYMHKAGQIHVNLSPKHLFIKRAENGDVKIRFIDLESCRSHMGFRTLKLRDLEKLHRTLRNVSRSDKLRMLLSYAGKSRVDRALRKDIIFIVQKTALKKPH